MNRVPCFWAPLGRSQAQVMFWSGSARVGAPSDLMGRGRAGGGDGWQGRQGWPMVGWRAGAPLTGQGVHIPPNY